MPNQKPELSGSVYTPAGEEAKVQELGVEVSSGVHMVRVGVKWVAAEFKNNRWEIDPYYTENQDKQVSQDFKVKDNSTIIGDPNDA